MSRGLAAFWTQAPGEEAIRTRGSTTNAPRDSALLTCLQGTRLMVRRVLKANLFQALHAPVTGYGSWACCSVFAVTSDLFYPDVARRLPFRRSAL